jgi:signal transduction histidine kinase
MTLRVRLMWLMLSMVAIVAATLTALSLNALTFSSIETAIAASEGAARQVQSFMMRRVSAPPAGNELAADEDLAALLEQTMVQSRAILEVNIAGADGTIEASSNPRRLGSPATKQPDLHDLRDAGPWDRLRAILTSETDYETRISLAIVGSNRPVFTVQILVSPVLLRAAVLPGLASVTAASGAALALAIVVAWLATRIALRPLAMIEHLIDNISSGKPPPEQSRSADETRELVAIESKLNLLGERYRGAQEDVSHLRTNLEDVLEKLDWETRRKFESQIALARRLTAINSLTGRAAHEIKNPLNSISLRLEMLRARMAEESPESGAEFDILSEEITRLDRVVRTFLDFNRPVELEPEDVDIGVLAAEVLDFLKPEAETARIKVTLGKAPDAMLVRADSNLLRQALLNIAVNAIEAMRVNRDGPRELSVQLDNSGENCVVRISDTGPGIPPQEKAKIFELYFTTKPRGSGIGLAITARTVQLCGGSIEVESQPGEGSTFILTLPLAGVLRNA